MRNLQQYLEAYNESHRNPVNQVIHFICVPAIFFSTLGLFWLIPVGQWLGLSPDVAPWVNGATILGVAASVFYIMMSLGSLLAMVVWFAVSVAGILAIQAAGWPLLWICAGIWGAAWVVQLIGHKIEGAKPSFFEDLEFLLVGPLFVMDELRHWNTRKPG